MIQSIIRKCDICSKEDSINCITGLCFGCEEKQKEKQFSDIYMLCKKCGCAMRWDDLENFVYCPNDCEEPTSNE